MGQTNCLTTLAVRLYDTGNVATEKTVIKNRKEVGECNDLMPEKEGLAVRKDEHFLTEIEEKPKWELMQRSMQIK